MVKWQPLHTELASGLDNYILIFDIDAKRFHTPNFVQVG